MNVETNDHQDIQKTALTPVEDRNILRRTAAWLDLLVKALAVFVPILYAIGRAYAHGYYEALGLSSTLMGFSVEHYLYIGYAGLSNSMTDALRFAGWPILIGALLVIVLALLTRYLGGWISNIRWRAPYPITWLDRAFQHFFNADHLPRLRKVLSVPIAVVGAFGIGWFLVIGFLIVLVLPVAAMQSYGGSHGVAEWGNYRKAESSLIDSKLGLVTYRDQTEAELRALLVECSVEWCAVFRDGKFSAIRTDTILEISRADSVRNNLSLKRSN